MTFRRTLSVLTNTAISGTAYAVSGAMAGPTGAKIMRDTGNHHYSTLEATEAGALAGFIVGSTIMLLKELAEYLDHKYHIISIEDADFKQDAEIIDKLNIKIILAELFLSPGTMAAGAAISHEILFKVLKMSVEMSVIALAVGQAVIASPFMLLALCCVCCYCLIHDSKKNNQNTQQSRLQANFANMWKRDSAAQLNDDAPEHRGPAPA